MSIKLPTHREEPVAELCRAHGISNASFYMWRAKYGAMDASRISQMKAMVHAQWRGGTGG